MGKPPKVDGASLHFLDSDEEDDLERAEMAAFGKVIDPSAKENLVCLDSSDIE